MKIERTIFKPRVRKLLGIGGVCFIRNRGSIYFLERTRFRSIELLRKAVNFETKEPREFYKIIMADSIKRKIKRIEYLERKIKELKTELKELKAGA